MSGMHLSGVKTLKGKKSWRFIWKMIFEVEEIVKFNEPLVEVLHLVDGDKHTMGFIYENMDQGKDAIKVVCNDRRQKYLALWKIIMIDGIGNSMQLAIT